MQRTPRRHLAWVVLAGALVLAFYQALRAGIGEPWGHDDYYHLALAREMLRDGPLEEFALAEDHHELVGELAPQVSRLAVLVLAETQIAHQVAGAKGEGPHRDQEQERHHDLLEHGCPFRGSNGGSIFALRSIGTQT